MFQAHNEHSYLGDFSDEIPGYLQNSRIMQILTGLRLQAGLALVTRNLRACYQTLVNAQIIPEGELELVDAWIADLGADAEYVKRASPARER